MSKKAKNVIVTDETKNSPITNPEKVHLGNAKLSDSKKAIKIHIFEGDKFFVIPRKEISDSCAVGRVYEYQDMKPEICGEIFKPEKTSDFYTMRIQGVLYHIKTTYINLLLNDTNLVLPIHQE